MQVRCLALASVLLSAAAHVQAAGAILNPLTVVLTIKSITDISNNTNNILKDAAPGNLITAIPEVLTNIKNIVGTITMDTNFIEGAGNVSIPTDIQSQICDAFSGFVNIQQNLFNTMISGKGPLAPVATLVNAALGSIEGCVDSLALSVIGLVPVCASQARADKNALDNSLNQAVQAFNVSLGLGGIR